MKDPFQLIVIGAGHVDKALAAIENPALDLNMYVHTLVDIVPEDRLLPSTKAMIANGAKYILAGEFLKEFSFPENPAAMVTTPNAAHLQYAEFLVRRRVKTLIEKPLVASLHDLSRLEMLNTEHPHLLYGMQAVADGIGVVLQFASGVMADEDPRHRHLKIIPQASSEEGVIETFESLGTLLSVEGFLLEGEGDRATLKHRPWLLEGKQGGMIRDLSGHLLSPLLDADLVTGYTTDETVTLGFHDDVMPLGEYRPVRSPQEADTYARMQGRFSTPQEGRHIPFDFRVGKYMKEDKLELRLTFERGVVELNYLPSAVLRILPYGEKDLTVFVDPIVSHDGLALLDFQRFLEEGGENRMDRGIRIVRFNEKMRAIGLRTI